MSIHDDDRDRDGAVDSAARGEDEVDEAADFVHPVDHGAGFDEEPLEREPAGSYVSGGEHARTAENVIDDDEKGDYVKPVDRGAGSDEAVDEDPGDYTESDHGGR